MTLWGPPFRVFWREVWSRCRYASLFRLIDRQGLLYLCIHLQLTINRHSGGLPTLSLLMHMPVLVARVQALLPPRLSTTTAPSTLHLTTAFTVRHLHHDSGASLKPPRARRFAPGDSERLNVLAIAEATRHRLVGTHDYSYTALTVVAYLPSLLFSS